MNRESVNQICATLPGAVVSDPWGGGQEAWKIGGKMFALVGSRNDGVSVKTASAATAQMLIETDAGIKPQYYHPSWVHLPWGTETEELQYRLIASYDIVRSRLTKKLKTNLPRRERISDR